ncbi:MAG: DUF6504 family protein [Bacteroidota bacterium]
MSSEINERVEVVAAFGRGGVRPRTFTWARRQYLIRQVTAAWTESEGFYRQHHFAVMTDGANIYELCFHTRDLAWCLIRIHHD